MMNAADPENITVLEAIDLTIKVDDRILIDRANFSIARGECWALMGPNGIGKSMLIATLAGLRPPASGRVLLAGTPIERIARRDAARLVALLLQDESSDFWGSTRDYVALGRYPHGDMNANGARIDTLLAGGELAARANAPFRTLSGGERQRARIAQLLAQAPALYLLDEPLNHLDPRHRAQLLAALATEQRAGRALLAALHSLGAVRTLCSHALLVYHRGQIVTGPVVAVLHDQAVRELYGLDPAANLDLL